MKQNRQFYLAILFSIGFYSAFPQAGDSIKVFFVGHGPTGEKFSLTWHGQEVLKFTTRGPYRFSFSIPAKKYGTTTGLNLFRKGRCGLRRRFIELNIYYVEGFKYLVLVRDETLKNRYAVRHFWTNEAPYVHHLRDE